MALSSTLTQEKARLVEKSFVEELQKKFILKGIGVSNIFDVSFPETSTYPVKEIFERTRLAKWLFLPNKSPRVRMEPLKTLFASIEIEGIYVLKIALEERRVLNKGSGEKGGLFYKTIMSNIFLRPKTHEGLMRLMWDEVMDQVLALRKDIEASKNKLKSDHMQKMFEERMKNEQSS